MDNNYYNFRLQEIIDMDLTLSVPELLYGKLTDSMRQTVREDILALKIESLDETAFNICRENILQRCRNLKRLLQEFEILLMIITKKRINTDDNEDHIDG